MIFQIPYSIFLFQLYFFHLKINYFFLNLLNILHIYFPSKSKSIDFIFISENLLFFFVKLKKIYFYELI